MSEERKVTLTEQQQAVVSNRGGNLLVAAAAGSGKTKVLVDRIMAQVCDEGKDINDFLVITYTKAAAAELRAKITTELSKRLAADPSNQHIQDQMHLVYAAQISTVHSFCSKVLRTNAAVAGLTPDFRVAEEHESKVLRADAMMDTLEAVYQDIEKHPNIKAFIDELAFGRDDEAVPAIVHSVYDTVQSHPWRDEWVATCLDNMDVSKYTDAMQTPWGAYLVEDIKRYIKSQIPLVETAINICDREEALSLAYAGALNADMHKLVCILSAKTWDQLYAIKDAAWERMKPVKKSMEYSVTLQEQVKSLRDRYKKAVVNKLKSIDGTSEEVLGDLQKTEASIRGMFEMMHAFEKRYREKKELHNILDFSDLEHKTIELLIDPKTKERTEVAKDLSTQYVEIMVDEYQDSNGVQETIFSAVSNGHNLFMVGDVKQSIYQFRLADPSIFLGHYNEYADYTKAKDDEPRRILLSKNFRSRPEVLEATNAVMQNCMSPECGGIEYGEEEALSAGRTDFTPSVGPVVELTAINMDSVGLTTDDDDEGAEAIAKTDVEARYVAQKVKELLANGKIMDEDTHEDRPITPNDIAILMRSTKNTTQHYVKALTDLGIATKSSRNGSIMDTAEIRTLYSFLQVIDSPLQDIPLVSVLASPLVGFSAEDIAKIKLCKPDFHYFYEAVLACAPHSTMCRQFVEQLERLRTMAPHCRLSELFTELLFLTDAEDVFGSMSSGEQRMANVQKFAEMITSAEAGGTKSLFSFICDMEALRDQGVELPQAAAGTLEDEAVSILSIHTSKGLEYPVVILSDLSRRFNTADQKGSALLHRELGAGVQVLDKKLMHRYPTIARTAIAAAFASESKSEELRILYVAMTRAKQKLIMTYCDKLERTMGRLASEVETPLPPAISKSVSNPGEWVLLTALTREESGPLWKVAKAAYAAPVSYGTPWAISVVEAKDVGGKTRTLEELESSIDTDEEAAPEEKTFPNLDVDKLEEDLAFVYPHQKATHTPSTAAASKLTGKAQKSITIRRPDFAKAKKGFTASERGTATHMFMQYANYQRCATEGESAIREEIARLKMTGFMAAEDADAILVSTLVEFFKSKAGRDLAMLPIGSMRREFPFAVLVPANTVYGEDAPDSDDVLLQGIIDMFVETDDGMLHIYDFKTDYIADEADEAEKTAHYKPQLEIYANALQAIYHKPVADKNLVFLRTGQQISC